MGLNYDFCGWATKNDIKCSDGRVIRANAFAHNDGAKVPLIWNHQHDGSRSVLGHALLENREEGVYAYGFFNETDGGKNAKMLVEHGDIDQMSIYANQLDQRGCDVIHGNIREVSLVLAGANSGARIENIIMHSDFEDIELEDECEIFTGIELSHNDENEDDFDEDYDEDEEEVEDEEYDEDEDDDEEDDEDDGELEHADTSPLEKAWKTLNEDQLDAVYTIIGAIINEKGEEEMKHNVFDYDETDKNELIHSGLERIISDAKSKGSMKESFLAHAAEYGIDNIDWLQPEYKNINGNGAPEFIKRQPDAWVEVVMSGVHHTPFSRIKMMFADLREDDARAKGYAQKGKLKKEEVFGLLKRTVDPTTIYKKQKLDRDDVIDITDFDVVSWLKSEMRMMLDEEIARAIVFGDGRSTLSEDKISESNIIPICKDEDLFNIKYTVTPASGESLSHALINAAVKAQNDYEGSGNTTMFIANTNITDMLLMEDTQGHRLYKDIRDIALAMSVNKIVKVPASIIPSDIYAVIVDLKDYNLGADKGGAVNMFDDFDIDYNQMKYLIETRCSGALTKPFSAITLKKAQG